MVQLLHVNSQLDHSTDFENGLMIRYFFGIEGRFTRLDWWIAQLIGVEGVFLVSYLFIMDLFQFEDLSEVSDFYLLVWSNLFEFFIIFPCLWLMISATVKRYHDHGKSGIWSLIWFFPYIGPLWVIWECGFTEGMYEYNVYDVPDSDSNSGVFASLFAYFSREKEPEVIMRPSYRRLLAKRGAIKPVEKTQDDAPNKKERPGFWKTIRSGSTAVQIFFTRQIISASGALVLRVFKGDWELRPDIFLMKSITVKLSAACPKCNLRFFENQNQPIIVGVGVFKVKTLGPKTCDDRSTLMGEEA